MAYFEQFRQLDGTSLYSGTISTTGAGSAIDTSYYGNILVQVSGIGTVQATIEGSNDQSEWFTITLNPMGDLSPVDTIYSEGGYQFKTSFQYIRYNIANYTGTLTLSILGRAGPGASAADNLAAAFNPDTPLNVTFGASVPKDQNGALILSDGIPYNLQGGRTYVFNLNGYSTIVLQLYSATITATCSQSIDGTRYTSTYFNATSSALTAATAVTGADIWVAPVMGQFLKVVVSGAVTSSGASILLKSAAFNSSYSNQGQAIVDIRSVNGGAVAQLPVNLQLLNGSTPVTAGVAGIQAVGGNIATGTAPTANPLLTAGIDVQGLTRTLRTDLYGRLLTQLGFNPYNAINAAASTNSNSPYANTQLSISQTGVIPATYQQSAALNVQETSQYEGQGLPELLAQVLLEMRILNQQIYELPRLIAAGQGSNDPPELFRQEPSIFNQ